MSYRENAVGLLFKLMARNYLDGRFYLNAAEDCKRLIGKNLFKKLAHQKRNFYKKIKYEIEVLEREIFLLTGKNRKVDENFKLPEPPVVTHFKKEQEDLINECYKREKQSLGMYNNILAKINIGKIREMLLFQKHSIQMVLQEIEILGFRDYEPSGNGKNEQQKNFK